MIKNRLKIILFSFLLLFLYSCSDEKVEKKIISPSKEDISSTVITTGVVEPQNRLEIKPSINGRLEDILVKEGDKVKKGDILVMMSSTERAVLVDAARQEGEDVIKYWEDVYKKTPIISPIDGEVIVRAVEPGQTVTNSDAVLVLSDRLIVNAQFDETDIGVVKIGQKAVIAFDAYPDIKINGVVDHVAYESRIVNNVTIYSVDILPDNIPEIMRSGMSVTVEVFEKVNKDAITVPISAVKYDNGNAFVYIKNKSGKIIKKEVAAGLNDGQKIEIVSGLSMEDKIILDDKSLLPKRKNAGENPFIPSRKRT